MTVEASPARKEPPARFSVAKSKQTEPLQECVRDALSSYFRQLDGHKATDLYQMVIAEVERPLFETVMQHAGGNQTHAARILGISRSTLRKKLAIYHLS